MDLQAFLGSAVIATLVSVLGGVVTKMLLDTRIEILKGDVSRQLESVKSDLSVWATFRNETIKEMWRAHRDIVAGMTKVILRIQELQFGRRDVLGDITADTPEAPKSQPAAVGDAQDAVEDYRKLVHQTIELLSPEDVNVCQQFLETAYSIASGAEPPNDANALKTLRGKFYEQMAVFFHLQDVRPWMTRATQ